MENDFTRKYRAKLAATKERHETNGSIKRMGMHSREKALTKMVGKGNVLKGLNIEGKKK